LYYIIHCWHGLLVCICLFSQIAIVTAQEAGEIPAADPMLALLQKMVAEDPDRADSWRLIGRIHHKQGEGAKAIEAFRTALRLQPDNAAAHFDYGNILIEVGDTAMASEHFEQVQALAPESSYAQTLIKQGRISARVAPSKHDAGNELPFAATPPAKFPELASQADKLAGQAEWWPDDPEAEAAQIDMAGYEIQTFDGADDFERRLNQVGTDPQNLANRFRAFVEFGSLYNSNVALTPISRELTSAKAASYQGFFSPDLEWILLQNGSVRSGPLTRGYFSVNENAFRALNLASFQPGVFVEADLPTWDSSLRIARIDYVYSLDLLGGDRFGDRHAITASLTTILPDFDVVYAYLTTNMSNFNNDGANPEFDSLDGTSISGGINRFFRTDWTRMPTWSLGSDMESANTEGDDFRYLAVNLYGDITFQLASKLSFVPSFGVGYRSYYDFTGPINRDEATWRGGGRLRWKWNEAFSNSLVFTHNRFASDNKQFDTERTELGIVFTLLH
jgi:tetratricopeptide (TPR) repeat protein